MDTNNRRDDLIAVAAVILLLIATATGNALVMFCMSAVGLSGMVLVHRKKADRNKLRQGAMIAAPQTKSSATGGSLKRSLGMVTFYVGCDVSHHFNLGHLPKANSAILHFSF